MSTGETLGERIQRLRTAKGWTQRKLAALAGVSTMRLSKYERGNYEPKSAVLGRLAMALETSADFLITGSETNPSADLRSLFPFLESLPEELRVLVFEALRGVIQAHHVLQLSRQAPRKGNPPAAAGG